MTDLSLAGPITIKVRLKHGDVEVEGDAEMVLEPRDLWALAQALAPYMKRTGTQGTAMDASGRDIPEQ